MDGPLNTIEEVLNDQIEGHSIYKVALSIKGSGGPTYIDSDTWNWKRFLCSKSFRNASSELCDSIARLARVLCTENLAPHFLKFHTAGRLVAHDKSPGEIPLQISPIGIG